MLNFEIEILIKKSFDETPFETALKLGKVEYIKALIAAGANINGKTEIVNAYNIFEKNSDGFDEEVFNLYLITLNF